MTNQWDDDHTKKLMRGNAAILRNFATQLQLRVDVDNFDITPDEALYLLRHIARFVESMTHLAEAASTT